MVLERLTTWSDGQKVLSNPRKHHTQVMSKAESKDATKSGLNVLDEEPDLVFPISVGFVPDELEFKGTRFVSKPRTICRLTVMIFYVKVLELS